MAKIKGAGCVPLSTLPAVLTAVETSDTVCLPNWAAAETMSQPPPIHVLLTEDNLSDAALVQLHLQQTALHCKVTHVTNLADALQALEERFDVVLLDLRLPDSDGLDTLNAIRRQTRTTPVVILSGQEDENLPLQAVRQGAQDYLRKREVGSDILGRTMQHAIERSRLHRAEAELAIAADAQKSLLPNRFPQLPNWELAGLCDPVAWAGGDYFDFAERDHDLWMVIADVCGHGVGAAILTAEIRGIVQTLIQTHPTAAPGELLTQTNHVLRQERMDGGFVVMFLAALNKETDTLQYAGAGHPAYVLDASGNSQQLLSNDPPIGVVPNHCFHTQTAQLQPGDLFLCYTDGVNESYDDNYTQFGDDRALQTVHQHRHTPAPQMLKQLFRQARDFSRTGAAIDDMAAILLKSNAR